MYDTYVPESGTPVHVYHFRPEHVRHTSYANPGIFGGRAGGPPRVGERRQKLHIFERTGEKDSRLGEFRRAATPPRPGPFLVHTSNGRAPGPPVRSPRGPPRWAAAQ